MKLYTKEMFLTAAEKCEVSMIDAKHIMQYIDEYVTPIELPSDEEVHKSSPHQILNSNNSWDIGFHNGWKHGAIWMRDKIQGGEL